MEKPTRRLRNLWILLGVSLGVLLVTVSIALQNVVPSWELAIFEAINGWQAPELVTTIARIVSDLVWVMVFVTAGALMLWHGKRKAVWPVAAAAGGAFVVTTILEHVVTRGRPDTLIAAQDMIVRATQDGLGFPSGHAATATAILVMLWPRLSIAWRVASVVFIALVCWSRVFLGVHLPLDVIAGVALALVVCSVMGLLPGRLRQLLGLEQKAPVQKT